MRKSYYSYNNTGSGVTIYVIDTGIRASHNDFGGRVKAGYTAISDGNGTNDCNGHGTHVAGTAAGSVYGVAKGASLVPVRVLDCQGSGYTSGVIAGVNWVTANKTLPSIANMSLGGGTSSALDTAIQNSINAGVTYVVAAGNDNSNACNYSPARVAAALTIGATTSTDARATYSNIGGCLDFFAPGSSILSDYYSSDTATATFNGTSMASPHAAGAAALYLSANPGKTPADVVSALINSATSNKVTNAGTGSPNRLLYTGFIGTGSTDTTPPQVALTAPTSGNTLSGNVTLAATATDQGGSGIARVDFRVDNALVNSTTSAPYTFSWNSNTVGNGSHTFLATATDGAGNTGSSNIVNADVSNGVPPPSACATSSQLLQNPGFESGNAIWQVSTTNNGAVIDSSAGAPARTGIYKAWLNGYGRTNTQLMYQQVTIPVNACSASFSFWLRITTSEPTSVARDTMTVTVRNTSGTVLRTLASYSNRNANNAYVQASFDLFAYKGQTIRLQFEGRENSSRATSFLMDDTAVAVME